MFIEALNNLIAIFIFLPLLYPRGYDLVYLIYLINIYTQNLLKEKNVNELVKKDNLIICNL